MIAGRLRRLLRRPGIAGWGALVLVLLMSVLLARPAASQQGVHDGAVADLREHGVHVSPRALGEASADAHQRLVEARAELARGRRDVAFVIAPGPVGSPGMTAYARRLHRAADLSGALVVTTPGRGVSFWGIDPRPDAVARIAASGADALPNPVERLVRAAEGAVHPDPEPDGVREVLILLLLAGLGAAWATAWGAHRTQRHERTALTEARTHLRVWVDALRAQAMALSITHLAPAARHEVDEVLALCSDTLTGLHTARTYDDVAALGPRVRDGFAALAHARGGDRDAVDPFGGLCVTDPAHGRAIAPWPGAQDPSASLCRDCARRAEVGDMPAARLVPVGAAVLPYTALREYGIVRPASGAPASLEALNA